MPPNRNRSSPSSFFDDLDEGARAWSPDDMLLKRETIELVRAYYRIGDRAVRRRLFELTKAMANLP